LLQEEIKEPKSSSETETQENVFHNERQRLNFLPPPKKKKKKMNARNGMKIYGIYYISAVNIFNL
jgi:hypothetical protein